MNDDRTANFSTDDSNITRCTCGSWTEYGKKCWYCDRVQPPKEEDIKPFKDDKRGCVRGEDDYQHCTTHDDVFSRASATCSYVLATENRRLRAMLNKET